MMTKPLLFAGKALELNLSTSAAGSIRIERLDQDSKSCPG